MKIIATSIAGLVVVQTSSYNDERGSFSRLFCETELANVLNGRKILQINQSRTTAVGAVRGMHYQHAPHAEVKLIRCLKGSVWDVAVDLRAESPTFLQWYAVELTPDNAKMIVIPEGCAHGYQVLEQDSELLYLHTASYCPSAEGGVQYNDPAIGVEWPLPVEGLSERDLRHSLITEEFKGLML